MKTTKKSQLEKKIEKLVSEKKLSKSNTIYTWLFYIVNGQKMFRPVYSTGSSWKHRSLHDRRVEFKTILNMLKIEYIEGNDAPKGGQTGAFISITTKII